MKEKPTVFLDNWSMHLGGTILAYAAPETNRYVLHGRVRGHPNQDRCPDGEFITTSHIEDLNIKEEFCETRNTMYTLGRPSSDYLKHLHEIGSESFEDLKSILLRDLRKDVEEIEHLLSPEVEG